MVKRLSKSRRSAILEHLLALEKQIRSELGADTLDGHVANPKQTKVRKRSLSARRRTRYESDDQECAITSEIVARFMH